MCIILLLCRVKHLVAGAVVVSFPTTALCVTSATSSTRTTTITSTHTTTPIDKYFFHQLKAGLEKLEIYEEIFRAF